MRSRTEKIVAKRARAAYVGEWWKPVTLFCAIGSIAWALVGAFESGLLLSIAGLITACTPAVRKSITIFVVDEERKRTRRLALLQAMGERAPQLCAVVRTPSAEELAVKVWPGGDIAELERHCAAIAAALRAQVVRVRADRRDAALASLVVVRTDRLEQVVEMHEATDVVRRVSLYQPVPLGLDQDGHVVSVELYGHHLPIGGEPGSGKSVTLSVLLAAAAFDPTVELWLFDAKTVELALWAPVATRFVGPEMPIAISALTELQEEMGRRYARIKLRGIRKVEQGDGERLIVIIVDELAFYVANGDKRAGQAFSEKLRDLVARARAAGIIVVAATQKPSTDLVPSALRDNFSFRLAHRCATRDASDTILGAGWAAEGYSASSIDPVMRGIGYVLAEGGVPRRMRTFSLSDFEIASIVRHARALRSEADPPYPPQPDQFLPELEP
jgi:DNA segregation ATPase FtsK/SpoIIIE-like protein